MSTWKITDRVIDGLASSKLSGALPAIDGSALTGVPGITKSASDPAIDTNPSGGVGTLWANTTSGELFACSDATTDSNVWTNIGSGTGDISPFHGAGSISGFCSGGSSPNSNVIDKFSFVSDADASDHGDLTAVRDQAACASSGTHGYTAGGNNASPYQVIIDKYAFASNTTAAAHGNLSGMRAFAAGHQY